MGFCKTVVHTVDHNVDYKTIQWLKFLEVAGQERNVFMHENDDDFMEGYGWAFPPEHDVAPCCVWRLALRV